jgi:signal peptidase II
MAEMAQTGGGGQSYVWGPLTPLGLTVALLAGVADQASKLWLLYGFDLEKRVPVAIGPFVDLVVTWNSGISYGLFQQRELLGAWALLAFKAVAVMALWAWLSRVSSRLTAVALGLIIGGAVGNAIDRLHWPGVMDFVLFHVETGSWNFRWYVFNLADVAIVAGVAILLYDSFWVGSPQKRPDHG